MERCTSHKTTQHSGVSLEMEVGVRTGGTAPQQRRGRAIPCSQTFAENPPRAVQTSCCWLYGGAMASAVLLTPAEQLLTPGNRGLGPTEVSDHQRTTDAGWRECTGGREGAVRASFDGIKQHKESTCLKRTLLHPLRRFWWREASRAARARQRVRTRGYVSGLVEAMLRHTRGQAEGAGRSSVLSRLGLCLAVPLRVSGPRDGPVFTTGRSLP